MTSPIVITGIGVVSPYGSGLEAYRTGMASGRSCIHDVTAYDLSACSARKGAYLTDFMSDEFDGSAEFGRVARGTQFSMIATEEAIRDCNLPLGEAESAHVGLLFSSSRIALEKMELFYSKLLAKGPRLVNPLHFQEAVNNAPASHISECYGITGPSLTITSGGTGAIQAVAVAITWLRLGRVDKAIVVSAESLTAMSQLAHSYAHGHAPVERNGVNECCPFDVRRNGYILGEGAVAFVLETESNAVARGAEIKATILSYGIVHEAFQVGRYHVAGMGIEKAMRQALTMSQIEGSSVNWILSAANSSLPSDLGEARAIGRVFGRGKISPPVSAIKSLIGETDAASGGFNMLAAITGIQDGLMYPTVNCMDIDPQCDLNHVLDVPKQGEISIAMINATWYGGGSSAAIIKKP